jgi:ABC-type transporter Mla subunit MlaD
MKNVRDLLKRRERRGGHGTVAMRQSSAFEVKLRKAVDDVRELFENLTKPYNKLLEAQESFYSAILKADNVLSQINLLISEWPRKA